MDKSLKYDIHERVSRLEKFRGRDEKASAEADPIELVSFELACIAFLTNGDPMRGLQAFVLAVERDHELPQEILDWVSAAFKGAYLEGRSVDAGLGLNAQKGIPSPFRRDLARESISNAMQIMAELVALTCTIPEAAELVEGLWARGYAGRAHGLSQTLPLSAATLKSRYRRWDRDAKDGMVDTFRSKWFARPRKLGQIVPHERSAESLEALLALFQEDEKVQPVLERVRTMYAQWLSDRAYQNPFSR